MYWNTNLGVTGSSLPLLSSYLSSTPPPPPFPSLLTRMKVSSMTTTLTSSWMMPTWAPCMPMLPSARTHLDPTPSIASVPPPTAPVAARLMKVWITSSPWQNMKWQSGAPVWSCPWMTQWSSRPLSHCPHHPPRPSPTLAGTDYKKSTTVRKGFVISKIINHLS